MMFAEKAWFPEEDRMLHLELILQFYRVQVALPRLQEEGEDQPPGSESSKGGSLIQVQKGAMWVRLALSSSPAKTKDVTAEGRSNNWNVQVIKITTWETTANIFIYL